MSRQKLKCIWRNPIYFVAFGFGAGAIPFAPGTWGTLVGVILYLIIGQIALPYYLILLAIAIAFGIWVCDKTEKFMGVKDHSGIVWDEIAGFLLVMVAAPAGWQWIAFGFVLFRIFDILKPWPIKTIDKHVKGGLGVMLDDLIAAIPAWAILQVCAYLVGSP